MPNFFDRFKKKQQPAKIKRQSGGFDSTKGVAQEMMGREGVSFIYCESCSCVFVAILESEFKRLVGVGCPECKYAWPLDRVPREQEA